MSGSRGRALSLYKQLLRYSEELQFTDKDYYRREIRNQFEKYRHITEEEQIQLQFQVSQFQHPILIPHVLFLFYLSTERTCFPQKSKTHLMLSVKLPDAINRLSTFTSFTRQISGSLRKLLDYSKYPTLNEADLEEQMINGTGPGGQKVNKAHNCVLLKHLPTGLVVKCHEYREAHKNRELARQKLLDKLDEHFNGENSVAAQAMRIERERSKIEEEKAAKLREMKKKFKEKFVENNSQAEESK